MRKFAFFTLILSSLLPIVSFNVVIGAHGVIFLAFWCPFLLTFHPLTIRLQSFSVSYSKMIADLQYQTDISCCCC